MRFSSPIARILLANLAPPFVGSLVLLHITALKYRHVLSLSETGIALTASAAAAFAGPLLVGLLARRVGYRATGWAGFMALLAGLTLLATSLSLPTLVAGILLLGLTYAAVVVLGSAELAAHDAANTHALIAFQYGSTAVGGVLAGPFFTLVTRLWQPASATAPPLWLLTAAAPLAAAAVLPSLLWRDYGGRPVLAHERRPLRLGAVWLLLLLGALHGSCDVGSYNWMPLWLQERAQASPALIASFISVTWLASLLGRGLTILLSTRLGSARALRLSSTGAALCLLLVVFAREPWAIIAGYAAYLACSAGNFPGLMAAANTLHPGWQAELNGLTLTALNGAGALVTYMLGRLGEASGEAWRGLPLPLTAMALFSILIWAGTLGPARGTGADAPS